MNLDLRVGLYLHRCHQDPRPLSPNLIFLVASKSLITHLHTGIKITCYQLCWLVNPQLVDHIRHDCPPKPR